MSLTISVLSPANGEDLVYPLAIICGSTTEQDATDVYIRGSDENDSDFDSESKAANFPVCNGKFKAHFLLRPGANHIRISHTSDFNDNATFLLRYTPLPPDPPYVRLVYLLASDSDGAFQTPDPLPQEDGVEEGTRRLHTAGLMIQAATAEMLHNQGFGRRTFALASEVETHRLTQLNTAQVLKLGELDLFNRIHSELSDIPNRSDIIDLVVMSFTCKKDGTLYAHTALGGGQLALFGGASVFTWPSSVNDISRALRDTRPIDSDQFFDDSGGRADSLGRRAITSTTIGALLHEMGHCFSLPHPCANAESNGGGIMSRGFDDINRLFVPSDDNQPLPFWDRGSAVRLRYHRFLQFPSERIAYKLARTHLSSLLSTSPDVEIYAPEGIVPDIEDQPFAIPVPSPEPSPEPLPLLKDEASPVVTTEAPVITIAENGDIEITSVAGLGHIGYYRNRDNASHDEFLETHPNNYILPSIEQIRQKCGAKLSDLITISVMDINGHITEEDYNDISAK